MLFFNFLCLFYLMVVINSYTISKNIDHKEAINDIVDSIDDLEYRREYKPKHDRLHHNYRRENKEATTNAVQEKEDFNVLETNDVNPGQGESETNVYVTTTKPIKKKHSNKPLHFWNKFRHRTTVKPITDVTVHKRKLPKKGKYYMQYGVDEHKYVSKERNVKFKNTDVSGTNLYRNRRRNGFGTHADKRKRAVALAMTSAKPSTLLANTPASSKLKSSSLTTNFRTTSNSLNTFRHATIQTYAPYSVINNISEAISEMTTRLAELKDVYGNYRVSPLQIFQATNTPVTNTETDFFGTAQIEALLNDIKVKAIKMLAEQNPSMTEMITNTVTETTFEADPILSHSLVKTPGYSLSTYISVNPPYSKRTVDANNTVLIANTEPTHNIGARSVKSDVCTIAYSIEDMLQRQLKKAYKNVKAKVCSDGRKEVYDITATTRKYTSKTIKKITNAIGGVGAKKTRPKCSRKTKQRLVQKTKPQTTLKLKPITTQAPNNTPHLKQFKRLIKLKMHKSVPETTEATKLPSPFDDFAMLTLFEQILAKTHQDNVMKMLTTSDLLVSDSHWKSKRGVEESSEESNEESTDETTEDTNEEPSSLTGQEDMEMIDDYDYSSTPTVKAEEPVETENTNSVTELIPEDTSYEGLSNKISYNDYVNGYKHYLKFQKEQGEQNFSNLVRYQAHRHHSVDDIGKYILNKIPQMPSRWRRYFEDDNMEDQDVSTKSDESWFKKHFYFFIDNGPPKKFHTSQTVALKSPKPNSKTGKGKDATKNAETIEVVNKKPGDDESLESSLDALSQNLYERKSKQFSSFDYSEESDRESTQSITSSEFQPFNIIVKSTASMSLVERLFHGKGRRTPKHTKTSVTSQEDSTDSDAYNNQYNYELNRGKRSKNPPTDESTDHFDKSIANAKTRANHGPIETRSKSYGYVDVNLIPRPTTIVKLRENKPKKGKIRKFFTKFHFHKRKKPRQKMKRKDRVKRYNALKKLKEIFGFKPDKAKVSDVHDYDIIRTHIETFKPVKYNKVLNKDELSREIPNITTDLSMDPMIEYPQYSLNKPVSLDNSWDTTESMFFYYSVTTSTPTYSFADVTTSRKHTTKKSHTKMKTVKTTTNSENWADYNKLLDTTIDYKKLGSLAYSLPTVTIENIKNEINNIESKMSLPDTKPVSLNQFTTMLPQRIYVPPHIQAQNDEPVKDLRIHTKLTRIAKFPLSHLKVDHKVKTDHVIERPLINDDYPEIAVDKVNLKREDKVLDRVPRSQSGARYDSDSYNYTKVGNKDFPDYFNDILMWHGDVLNTDKVTSATWENILKKIADAPEISTQSKADMEKEVLKINDFLHINDDPATGKKLKSLHKMNKKDKERSNHKNLPGVIRTIALRDNAIAKSNDVVIRGEANYFHVIKQPSYPDKFAKLSGLMTDLNRIYFKSPEIKYNIDTKIQEAKRNGDFWKDNIEDDKNKYDKKKEGTAEIFVDTTLLAYDDGPDYLMNHLITRKNSKNSLPSTKNTKAKAKQRTSKKPMAKMNKSPKQYFSTPLPMQMDVFEEFLQENGLDVKSVTRPITELPAIVDAFSKKVTLKAHNIHTKNMLTKKAVNPSTTSKSTRKVETIRREKAIDYDNYNIEVPTYNSESDNNFNNDISFSNYDNYNKDIGDKRQKRYSVLEDFRVYTDEPADYGRDTLTKISRGLFKKKMKLFDARSRTLTDHVTGTESPMDKNYDKDIELTIISLDDNTTDNPMSLITNDDVTSIATKPASVTEKLVLDSSSDTLTNGDTAKMEARKPTTTKFGKYSVAALKNKLKATLLHNHHNKTVKTTKAIHHSTTKQKSPGFSTTVAAPWIGLDELNKLHVKNNDPKRIRISSHSYKYDIIYDQKNKLGYRRHSLPNKSTTSAKVKNYVNKPSYNSDFIHAIRQSDRDVEIIEIVKAIEAVENFTRPNNLVYIDLPTYYEPETGATEPAFTRKPKSVWNDYVLKYLSGIYLIELLTKFGILKAVNGDFNSTNTNGMDKTINANEVFSGAEDYGDVSQDLNRSREPRRRARQVTSPLKATNSARTEEELTLPNWREKRRLKLLSHIKGKLRKLMVKSNKKKKIHDDETLQDENLEASTDKFGIEDQKLKREKQDDVRLEGLVDNIPIDYNDIDKIDMGRISQLTTPTTTAYTETVSMSPYFKVFTLKKNSPTLSPSHKLLTPVSLSNVISTHPPSDADRKDAMYYESSQNQMYYEPVLMQRNFSTKSTPSNVSGKVGKRDITCSEKCTAKNVAAIDVIVDLVKNTVSIEDPVTTRTSTMHAESNPSVLNFISRDLRTLFTTPSLDSDTNSIQVRIAIPYNMSTNNLPDNILSNNASDKKRSLNTMRLRRVFSAKMSKPVDLEYQLHLEDLTENPAESPIETSTKSPAESTIKLASIFELDDKNGPRMFLLIDSNGPIAKGKYVLKPFKGNVDLSNIVLKQADATTVFKSTSQATTVPSINNVSKVTLSKDFVSAINKHLIELYENLTYSRASEPNHVVKIRNTENNEPMKKIDVLKTVYRRHINWNAVKKYFGHDRVCNCKCKPNRTMCRACAASDAVISELIFEFDNLAEYMKDHCTEIQTFFWMNPSGGKKLRDSVHNVDNTLNNYFKRVKGKCQGRTCKTFSTCIDKRSIVYEKKLPKRYIGYPLISDLQKIAHDIDTASKYDIACNENLIIEGQRMLNTINNCIGERQVRNQSDLTINPSQRKNVYSLDKINVKIICSSPKEPNVFITSPSPRTESSKSSDYFSNNIPIDYEYDKLNGKSKGRGLLRFFSRHYPGKYKVNDLLSYFTTNYNDSSGPYKSFHKRQAQIESPLIADSVGAFWKGFLKGKKLHTSLPTTMVADKVKVNEITTSPATPTANIKSEIGSTKLKTTPLNHVFQRDTMSSDNSTVESLSYNINELFKIFRNLTDLKEVHSLSGNSDLLNSNYTTTTSKTKKVKTKKHKEIKTKLNNKFGTTTPMVLTSQGKTVASKSKDKNCTLTKNKRKPTKTTCETTTTTKLKQTALKAYATAESPKTESATASNPEKTLALDSTINSYTRINSVDQTKSNFLGRVKSVTIDFFCKRGKCTNKAKVRESRSQSKEQYLADENSSHIFSAPTTENTPSILIIKNYDDVDAVDDRLMDDFDFKLDKKEDNRFKDLLMSILSFEAQKLKNEWRRFKKEETKLDSSNMQKASPTNTDSLSTLPKSTCSKFHVANKDYAIMTSTLTNLGKFTSSSVSPPASSKGTIRDFFNKFEVKIVHDSKPPNRKTSTRRMIESSTTSNRPQLKRKTTRIYDNKAGDPISEHRQLCDIEATLKHLMNAKYYMPYADFAEFVKNIKCYKYKRAPNNFTLAYRNRRRFKMNLGKQTTIANKKGRIKLPKIKWDWIRSKRSVSVKVDGDDHGVAGEESIANPKSNDVEHFEDVEDDESSTQYEKLEFDIVDGNDDYEMFDRDQFGIYRRGKRSSGLNDLKAAKGIPFTPEPNETYAILGDSIIIECSADSSGHKMDQVTWKTDRRDMLMYDNVAVVGARVFVRDVVPRNQGVYICKWGKAPDKHVKLTVVTPPKYESLFTAVYSMNQRCTYDDLRAVQPLGRMMSRESCPGSEYCSVRVDEPVCLRDGTTGSPHLRLSAAVAAPHAPLGCGARCQRDLQAALALLVARNADTLVAIPVLLTSEERNKTLVPLKPPHRRRFIITHTLRRSRRPVRQRRVTPPPGRVKIVMVCPGGFHLLADQKLCSACPAGSWSRLGANACRRCARGARSDPGEHRCRLRSRRVRRYVRWWYPSVGVGMGAAWCAACLLTAAAAVHARTLHQRHTARTIEIEVRARVKPSPRPLSPSRVILAKFFRGSRSSTRLTDSQETKFGLWKEKHMPPPLPPIDFDCFDKQYYEDT